MASEPRMLIEDLLRTLEGAARYDQRQGSSRSSKLTRQRRQEVLEAVELEKREAVAAAYRAAGRIFQKHADARHHSGSMTVALAIAECETAAVSKEATNGR